MRRDEEAVSPVIAVILMVAITVVLTAVLYSMVGNLIIQPSSVTPGVILTHESENATTERLQFSAPTMETKWMDISVFFHGENETRLKYLVNDDCTQFVNSSSSYTITINDLAGSDCYQRISLGDYLSISPLSPGRYMIQVFHIPSEGIMADTSFIK